METFVDVAEKLTKLFGPVGFVCLLGWGVTLGACKQLWDRLKERELECSNQITVLTEQWNKRFLELRNDSKESFLKLEILTKQLLNILAKTAGMKISETP